jgi:hypothetical protein
MLRNFQPLIDALSARVPVKVVRTNTNLPLPDLPPEAWLDDIEALGLSATMQALSTAGAARDRAIAWGTDLLTEFLPEIAIKECLLGHA